MRGNVWFVQKRLSPILTQHLGKKMLQQSTQTGDLDAACRIRDQVLVELSELEALLLGQASPAQRRRQFIEARERFKEYEESIISDEPLTLLDVIEPERLSEIEQDALRSMYSGQTPDEYRLSLKAALEDWLYSPLVERKPSTRSKNSHAVELFLSCLGGDDVVLAAITRKQVRGFITEQLHLGKTKQTVANYLSGLSALWRHAEYTMEEPLPAGNPFKGHSLNPKATVKSYDQFTRDDVEAIFKATEEAEGIFYLLPRLGFYTGARLEELCSLKTTDIIQQQGVWCLSVREGMGKNSNATRDVPLHSAIKPLVLEQLKQAQAVGSVYLFPEAGATNRSDGKKGPKFSQWFSRLTEKTIPKQGRKVSFHSFRTTAITIMLGAGFQEQLVVWVTGHERGLTTASKVYHRGPDFKMRLKAVEAIKVEALLEADQSNYSSR
ncbi:tyrosine-type recombinase/integrase [Billgrantia aerodenitrificans]|uniref:Tyrosine-type recombinase/integrase n=1 Tax=Billgrantia aerodenitrificans TaxID=2733483 RepID=A0ABS9ANQ0_9GAMM|nr:tyrosine-type recombinase/integrase [Halomonas aerodenitrificans]MCE8023471.1 tyrosine-type recombinase/integrase [Halomonas aerodenitrificans]